MRLRPALPALLAAALLLPALPGCDSGGGGGTGLQASYFVGAWALVGVRDGSGDRTSDIDLAVDDLDVTFTAGGQYTMVIDYSAAANGAGTADTTLTGGYAVSSGGALVLTTPSISLAFGVVTEGTGHAELSASALLINPILPALPGVAPLTGTATLVIERP